MPIKPQSWPSGAGVGVVVAVAEVDNVVVVVDVVAVVVVGTVAVQNPTTSEIDLLSCMRISNEKGNEVTLDGTGGGVGGSGAQIVSVDIKEGSGNLQKVPSFSVPIFASTNTLIPPN